MKDFSVDWRDGRVWKQQELFERAQKFFDHRRSGRPRSMNRFSKTALLRPFGFLLQQSAAHLAPRDSGYPSCRHNSVAYWQRPPDRAGHRFMKRDIAVRVPHQPSLLRTPNSPFALFTSAPTKRAVARSPQNPDEVYSPGAPSRVAVARQTLCRTR
jgi:hypothetical protein